MAPWLLLVLTLAAQDSVRVTARLTGSDVEVGERTTLRVEVRTDGARARIESFQSLPPGLELVGTRESDQRQFSFPGGSQRFVTRDFVLRAAAPGRYRVPSVRVVVGARTYTTPPRLLDVAAGAGAPGGGAGPGASAPQRGPTGGAAVARASADGVLMRAWLEKDTAFVGEQVTMNVDVLFSPDARLRLRRAPEYQPPSPGGFWIQDLPDPTRTHTEAIGGELYEVQTFRRAFFPLTAGRFEIPPAQLDFEIRRGLLYAPETSHVATDPVPLVVRPLPEAGRPDGFTGAVGRYAVRSWLEPDSVPAGEAAVLNVEVTGTGNLKALPPPSLPALPGIEAFPPTEEAETRVSGDTVEGRKRFSWVLIPRRSGSQAIPAIRYPYFDPGAGRYAVATAPALTLDVGRGQSAGASEAEAGPTLRYIRRVPRGRDPVGWVSGRWFAALQLVPLLLLAGALALRRRRSRNGASMAALRRARRAALRSLAERAERGDASVPGEAYTFARSWLARRLGHASPMRLSADDLSAAGVSAGTARSVRAALDRLAAARYAPEPPPAEVTRDLVRHLSRVLELVDREAPPPVARSSPAAAFLLIPALALGASEARAQDAAASPAGAFERAVRLFDGGEYAAAASAFRAYVVRAPRDPAGWYDLGTSYERAGHRGYAVWAWLHAVRLSPRDRDVRHNLRAVGTAPELVARVTPPLFLRPEELWLLAALAWWVAAAGAAWWLARRRRGALVVAGVALVLALGGVAAGWASTRGDEMLIVLEPTPLRAGPNLRGEVLSELDPGMGLEMEGRQGEWIRARTRAGDEGWVEARATGTI